MEQSSMLFQKDGKNYLQLDCENAKELFYEMICTRFSGHRFKIE